MYIDAIRILKRGPGYSHCPRLCTHVHYKIRRWPLALKPELFDNTMASWLIYITVDSDQILERKEYLVYDNAGFIANVGGGLGLFIGFSFYDLFASILDYLVDILSRNSFKK